MIPIAEQDGAVAVATDPEETPAGRGVLQIIDPTGDTKLEWSRGNEIEVEAAKASYDLHKRKGYLAYKMNPDGGRGEVLTAFDPAAERIVMAPPVRGG